MQYELGVQSFTYRNFSAEEICEELQGTRFRAVEFCGVHITPDADEDEIEELKNMCEDAGLRICGYGVHGFSAPEDVRPVFAFASSLGADYVSADFEPDDTETINELIACGEEFDLKVAIHNHGPQATYSTVEDVLSVVDNHPSPIGACVDTGHFFRSGQTPQDVIPKLGERVFALHLKDFIDESTEVVPGKGNLDLAELIELLGEHTSFDQPLVIEYEEDADNPTPAVLDTAERLAAL